MKKKLFAMLLLCLCLCFSFSGCNFTLKAVDKMMHPPALSGENAGIQKAFEKAVNDKNIVMKHRRQAIIARLLFFMILTATAKTRQ